VVLLWGCKENGIFFNQISGYVQKGPFITGSSVTIFDLEQDLTPTGMSYNTTIKDNNGSFELNHINLSSGIVKLKADGFYFNEISGKQSVSQITLYAIANVIDKSNINVNILTHLEKDRIVYLMKNGKSFAEAKIQAQKEVLNIFNIIKNDIKSFEQLNISENDEDNAILLAISAILQGFRSEAELTEILANICDDIKEDGILNNENLGSALVSHAKNIDTIAIKNNLVKRYDDIGTSSNIPDFGKYIKNFINNTNWHVNQSLINYPEKGIYGDNILYLTRTNINSGENNFYSLSAELTENTYLKIRITSLSNYDSIKMPYADMSKASNVLQKASWYYLLGSGINWLISEFDDINYSQTFTAIETGKKCDLKLFFDKGSFFIEYFEMSNSESPTFTKTIYAN